MTTTKPYYTVSKEYHPVRTGIRSGKIGRFFSVRDSNGMLVQRFKRKGEAMNSANEMNAKLFQP